jgi:hypothetical protein
MASASFSDDIVFGSSGFFSSPFNAWIFSKLFNQSVKFAVEFPLPRLKYLPATTDERRPALRGIKVQDCPSALRRTNPLLY